MRFFYSAAVFFYVLAIRMAAVAGNKKAKLWVGGRKNILQSFESRFKNQQPNSFVWFHVSSLGEFEQGRPLMEQMKRSFPHKKLLLTFFSPSGYEMRKDYSYADVVMYLPADRIKVMRKLMKIIQPSCVIFVKYDFWFHLIQACYEMQCPVYFVSSSFRPNQYFFSWWGKWFIKQLKKVNVFFVQTHSSVDLLRLHQIEHVVFAGDTRLDRVIEIRNENEENIVIQEFAAKRKTIIAGSSWPADEEILFNFATSCDEIGLIIAPHEVSDERVKSIEKLFKNSTLRYSEVLQNGFTKDARVLIIDTMGILSKIYKYCYFAYIGNGFGKGIHNILESVVYGKPVVFGPNYHPFTEATELVRQHGAFSISNSKQFHVIAERLMNNPQYYQKASEVCLQYVEENRGATQKIIQYLSNNLQSEKYEKNK